MGILDDFMSKQPNFHKDKDGSWGTDYPLFARFWQTENIFLHS